ncbi:MAG: hypothetical protein EA356_12810 [Geminicoccaceae bacterium]|nr:MAG: hypothetical protein EA356_12810 [Geminicoccaceae bacterium]
MDVLADERVLDVSPRLEPRVGEPYSRRLNYVAGRTLTADALALEQRHRARRLQFLARAVTPGILRGFELRTTVLATGAPALIIGSGQGLTHTGEEVRLHRALTVPLAAIPPAEPLIEDTAELRGLAVLVLQPVRAVAALAAAPDDPCPTDLDAYPFADLVTVDAARLAWFRVGEAAAPSLDGADTVRLPPNPLLGRTTPVRVPGAVWQNTQAKRLFDEEAAFAARGLPPAWAEAGMPLALVALSAAGELLFVDRFAAARFGGAVREGRPAARLGLPPTLRRARLEQFVDQLQSLRAQALPLAPLRRHFRYLPPIGLLPASLVDFAHLSTDAFPPIFRIEAAPVPLEQLEAALTVRAGLDGYDLQRHDHVQLLVPVPEHLYEPRLLVTEVIDAAFDQAIQEARLRATQHEATLAELQAMEGGVIGLIERRAVEPYTAGAPANGAPRFAEQAQAIVQAWQPQVVSLPVGEIATTGLSVAAYAQMVRELDAAGGAEPADRVFDATEFVGLKPRIEALQRRVEAADDQIDLGFTRLQAEIYRARKALLGEQDATRLATSPILADLAGKSGIETSQLIQGLFKTQREPPEPRTHLRSPETGTPRTVAGDTSGATSFMAARHVDTMNLALTRSVGWSMTNAPQMATPTTTITSGLAAVIGSQFTAQKALTAAMQVSTSAITLQGVLFGKAAPVRTVTIAERLRPSPAQEAKNAAVAAKAEIIDAVQRMELDLLGLPLPIPAGRSTLVEAAVWSAIVQPLQNTDQGAFAIFDDRDAAQAVDGYVMLNDRHLRATARVLNPDDPTLPGRVAAIAAQLYAQRIGLDAPGLADLVLADRLDPDPANGDEADFYAAAIDALENAVSILRLVEGRIEAHRRLLDILRQRLIEAYTLAERWRGAIEDANAALAEARHDAAVAMALRAEETARLDAINQRRRDVLQKHVDIVAFARPRGIDRFVDAPGIDLFQPLQDPIPICLERGLEPPEALADMVQSLRQAPIGWFVHLRDGVRRLDQSRHLLQAWRYGRHRARFWLDHYGREVQAQAQAGAAPRLAGPGATGVRLAVAAMQARVHEQLQARIARPLEPLEKLGWQALGERATAELSIEDLAEAGRAGAALARDGLVEVARIGTVAACFLEELRGVAATTRLQWAEALSMYDAPVDLTDITRAPSWTAIPFERRRLLEHLHRWLVGRIDQRQPGAASAMSEVIRVCLLLSSHAPVSDIVEGRIERPLLVNEGQRFEVSIVRGTVAAGMLVTFGPAARQALGVVRDVVGTTAVVDATQVPGGSVSVAADTTLAFARAAASRLLART